MREEGAYTPQNYENEIYKMWETRLKEILESAGMNIYANSELIDSMFDCAEKYLNLHKD